MDEVARTGRHALATAVAALLALFLPGPASGQGDPGRPAVERAVAWMGGESALRNVDRVALSMMTQWQRPDFRSVPFTDRPSFEAHTDVRDYSLGAWRNTRHFPALDITNLVRDSVSFTDRGSGFEPLSRAYVDERNELFLYTPDRLMLALLDATDLRSAGDTTIGGEPHEMVTASTAAPTRVRAYLHAGTGLPTLLRFRAGHPADFGLVPWGVMDVEVWYSNWRTFGELSVPTQWDILRNGEPYKRMTVRRATFNPDFAADSFAVSGAMREAYWSSPAPRPMHEARRVQAVEEVGPGVVALQPAFGVPSGAVRTTDGWLLLGAGQAGFNLDDALEALRTQGVDPVIGILVAQARAGNGGVARAVERGLPILASPSAEPFVRTMLENAGLDTSLVEVVHARHVLGSGAEAVVLDPIDLPDAPGSLVVYAPERDWMYVPDGVDPLALRMANAHAEAEGWVVRFRGDARAVWQDGS